jgi:hypothetical protein
MENKEDENPLPIIGPPIPETPLGALIEYHVNNGTLETHRDDLGLPRNKKSERDR